MKTTTTILGLVMVLAAFGMITATTLYAVHDAHALGVPHYKNQGQCQQEKNKQACKNQ